MAATDDVKDPPPAAVVATNTGSQTSLSNSDSEKQAPARTTNLERAAETDGYILDESLIKDQYGLDATKHLKKSEDGKVLIPQPSDSQDDPLNWSPWKKASVLIVLVANAFTADYSAATGASALLPQAEQWKISPDTVNHATAGNTFMLGIGGLATVWLSAWIGRLPTLFWFGCLSAGTAAWTAAAQSFESYMTARILNGLFCVAAAGGGLMWIKDVWFFHQHPRKINIWSTAIILSPFLGPQFMAAILAVSTWRVGMWLCFGIIVVGLLATVLLGEETFYPRHLAPEQIPLRRSRLMRLVGVEQYRSNWTTNGFLESGMRLVTTITRLPVFLVCLFYFFDFPWTIGNNTTISVFIVPAYDFTFNGLAAIYTAPVVGAILGLVIGHFLFDFLGKLYARYHGGKIDPEARLLVLWLILPLKILGYNLIGVTLEQHWSWWILAVGWALHNFATIVTTTAVGSYLIDAYPEASGESAAWLNFSRTLGGFVVGYFQIGWASSAGTQTAYGIQSGIMGAAFMVIVALQFGGKRLRSLQGPLNFKTN